MEGFFQETVDSGVRGENVITFSKDIFEFEEAMIVRGNKRTGAESS